MRHELTKEYNSHFHFVLSVLDVVAALSDCHDAVSDNHTAVGCLTKEASERMLRLDEIVKDGDISQKNIVNLKERCL